MGMLTSAPTKFGAGITLYGDFLDLDSLHNTIHKIASEECLEAEVQNFILALAYDIRKAKERKREVKELGIDKEDRAKYKGVSVLWPHFLPQVALLRRYAGYRNTDHRDQACLYLLEDCAITSLLAFDQAIGSECVKLFLNLPPFPNDYLFEYCSECCRELVEVPGRGRFQRLPGLLKSMSWMSPDYTRYAAMTEQVAKKLGAAPSRLRDSRKWPDFQW